MAIKSANPSCDVVGHSPVNAQDLRISAHKVSCGSSLGIRLDLETGRLLGKKDEIFLGVQVLKW